MILPTWELLCLGSLGKWKLPLASGKLVRSGKKDKSSPKKMQWAKLSPLRPNQDLEYGSGEGFWRPWSTLIFNFFTRAVKIFFKLFSGNPVCQNWIRASLFGRETGTRVCLALFSSPQRGPYRIVWNKSYHAVKTPGVIPCHCCIDKQRRVQRGEGISPRLHREEQCWNETSLLISHLYTFPTIHTIPCSWYTTC